MPDVRKWFVFLSREMEAAEGYQTEEGHNLILKDHSGYLYSLIFAS